MFLWPLSCHLAELAETLPNRQLLAEIQRSTQLVLSVEGPTTAMTSTRLKTLSRVDVIVVVVVVAPPYNKTKQN